MDKITSAILSDCTITETLGYPIVTVSGKNEVRIENHKGISEYVCDAITVVGKKYNIRVSGLGLTIKSMNSDALIITGEINAITF